MTPAPTATPTTPHPLLVLDTDSGGARDVEGVERARGQREAREAGESANTQESSTNSNSIASPPSNSFSPPPPSQAPAPSPPSSTLASASSQALSQAPSLSPTPSITENANENEDEDESDYPATTFTYINPHNNNSPTSGFGPERHIIHLRPVPASEPSITSTPTSSATGIDTDMDIDMDVDMNMDTQNTSHPYPHPLPLSSHPPPPETQESGVENEDNLTPSPEIIQALRAHAIHITDMLLNRNPVPIPSPTNNNEFTCVSLDTHMETETDTGHLLRVITNYRVDFWGGLEGNVEAGEDDSNLESASILEIEIPTQNHEQEHEREAASFSENNDNNNDETPSYPSIPAVTQATIRRIQTQARARARQIESESNTFDIEYQGELQPGFELEAGDVDENDSALLELAQRISDSESLAAERELRTETEADEEASTYPSIPNSPSSLRIEVDHVERGIAFQYEPQNPPPRNIGSAGIGTPRPEFYAALVPHSRALSRTLPRGSESGSESESESGMVGVEIEDQTQTESNNPEFPAREQERRSHSIFSPESQVWIFETLIIPNWSLRVQNDIRAAVSRARAIIRGRGQEQNPPTQTHTHAHILPAWIFDRDLRFLNAASSSDLTDRILHLHILSLGLNEVYGPLVEPRVRRGVAFSCLRGECLLAIIAMERAGDRIRQRLWGRGTQTPGLRDHMNAFHAHDNEDRTAQSRAIEALRLDIETTRENVQNEAQTAYALAVLETESEHLDPEFPVQEQVQSQIPDEETWINASLDGSDLMRSEPGESGRRQRNTLQFRASRARASIRAWARGEDTPTFIPRERRNRERDFIDEAVASGLIGRISTLQTQVRVMTEAMERGHMVRGNLTPSLREEVMLELSGIQEEMNRLMGELRESAFRPSVLGRNGNLNNADDSTLTSESSNESARQTGSHWDRDEVLRYRNTSSANLQTGHADEIAMMEAQLSAQGREFHDVMDRTEHRMMGSSVEEFTSSHEGNDTYTNMNLDPRPRTPLLPLSTRQEELRTQRLIRALPPSASSPSNPQNVSGSRFSPPRPPGSSHERQRPTIVIPMENRTQDRTRNRSSSPPPLPAIRSPASASRSTSPGTLRNIVTSHSVPRYELRYRQRELMLLCLQNISQDEHKNLYEATLEIVNGNRVIDFGSDGVASGGPGGGESWQRERERSESPMARRNRIAESIAPITVYEYCGKFRSMIQMGSTEIHGPREAVVGRLFSGKTYTLLWSHPSVIEYIVGNTDEETLAIYSQSLSNQLQEVIRLAVDDGLDAAEASHYIMIWQDFISEWALAPWHDVDAFAFVPARMLIFQSQLNSGFGAWKPSIRYCHRSKEMLRSYAQYEHFPSAEILERSATFGSISKEKLIEYLGQDLNLLDHELDIFAGLMTIDISAARILQLATHFNTICSTIEDIRQTNFPQLTAQGFREMTRIRLIHEESVVSGSMEALSERDLQALSADDESDEYKLMSMLYLMQQRPSERNCCFMALDRGVSCNRIAGISAAWATAEMLLHEQVPEMEDSVPVHQEIRDQGRVRYRVLLDAA